MKGSRHLPGSGRYFGCVDNAGKNPWVWYFDGHKAVRVGVPTAGAIENAHVIPRRGEDLFAAVAKKLQANLPHLAPFTLEDMELAPGQFYPRMARIVDQHIGNPHPGYTCPGTKSLKSELATMSGQLVSLTQKLAEICQTVHPSRETFNVYGHEIRNLLILACTEVEVHWRGVLEANGKSGRFSTNIYVILQSAMRLGEYSVALPYYPWLSGLRPFDGWNAQKPTDSLPWYRAYNHVKHDRENAFAEGMLIHAIHAVTACAVMLFAQFGTEAFRARKELGTFFDLAARPAWKLSEAYTIAYPGHATEYTPVRYPF